MSPSRTTRWTALGVLASTLSCYMTTGCSMCCHPYDYSYTYYGARWQRSDMERGRVGSAFYPAGEQLIVDPPEMAPPPPPKKVDPDKDDEESSEKSDGEESSSEEELKPKAKTLTEPIRYRREAARASSDR